MINAIPMTTLLNVDPNIAVRAQRLQFAIELLERKHDEADVCRRVRKQFDCSRWTARRTVLVAKDLAQ